MMDIGNNILLGSIHGSNGRIKVLLLYSDLGVIFISILGSFVENVVHLIFWTINHHNKWL